MHIENVFEEFNHALMDLDHPSEYFKKVIKDPVMDEQPLFMLKKMLSTEQHPQHHPEGNVWIHTVMVIDEAARAKKKSKNPQVFMWSALLHDIGKPVTTKLRNGKITSYNHDKVGAELAREFLSGLNCEEEFIEKVSRMVRWHMQIMFVVRDLAPKQIGKMKKEVDIREIALLGWCDRMGRGNADAKKQKAVIDEFLARTT